VAHAVSRLIGVLLALVILLSASLAVADDALAAKRWSGTYNLYRDGVFVTQYTWTWCVGASAQAMLNIIKDTSNTSRRRQKRLVTYAMNNDEHFDSNSGGSDAVGFARTLTRFGGGTYEPRVATTYRRAVRRAVKHIRRTGRPAGLLVKGGRHAWVLTGFDATADPARTNNFTITHVYVMGPLYPKQTKGWYDLPPNTRLTWRQFKQPFRRFDDPDSPRFIGYWVTVNPI
jgi:hypothetical protein